MRRHPRRRFERARKVPLRETRQTGQSGEGHRLGQVRHEVVRRAPDLPRREHPGAARRRFGAQPQEVDADRHRERVEIEPIEPIGVPALVRQTLRQSPESIAAK